MSPSDVMTAKKRRDNSSRFGFLPEAGDGDIS